MRSSLLVQVVRCRGRINPMTDKGWSVLMPVKVLAEAKSRLAGLAGLSGPRRAQLALALASDTVTAVLGSDAAARVIIITDDQVAAVALAALGALIVPDEPRAGLNAALRHGAGDAAARSARSFVADAAGDGTTLYTAGPGAAFQPAFGLASRARHGAGGAAEL